jgi:uncharacterized protein (DUF1501 family)
MKTKINQNRRSFLQNFATLAGSSALLSSYGGLQLIQSAVAAPGNYAGLTDYKSLVCVFLPGGNDAFNTFVPNTDTEYQKYAAVRQNMAVARGSLHPIAGGSHGFHPTLPDLRDLYNTGKLAVINNVGNLFQPITRDEYFNHTDNHASLNLPLNLFAHDHQQETWQTSLAPVEGTVFPGWGGRMTDLLAAANTNPDVPPAFTIAGNNLWQSSEIESSRAFSLESRVPVFIDRFQRFNPFQGTYHDAQRLVRSLAWEEIINLPYTDPLQAHTATAFLDTRRRANLLRDALDQTPEITTPYNDRNGLAQQLRAVAQMIAVRQDLGLKRQTFFVSLGSFDTHGDQLTDHPRLLAELNEALSSFQQALAFLQVEDSVTTFTASEFGRTLTSNGDGTDHAWATDYMVMGGAVDGGKMYGTPIEYSDVPEGVHATPGSAPEKLFGPRDVGSGRFIPAYSTDQYGATLANWMGVNDDDLLTTFPNLENFSAHDLGFIKS